MSLTSSEKNVCLVCNVETNSIHNSVNSCRACSAFFRRGILNHKNFRCRRGNKNCIMKPGDKLFCKYCRFQKCKAVGMVLKNVTSESPSDIPYIISSVNECKIEESFIPPVPADNSKFSDDIKIEDNKILLDMKQTNSYVNNIFSSSTSSLNNLGEYTTCLQRIIIGVKNLFTNLNYTHPENVILTREADIRRFVKAWQRFIKFSPTLLMSLEEFVNFSLKDKWTIFRSFWRDAYTLVSSVYLSKIKNPYNGPIILCDERHLLKLDGGEITDPNIDDKSSKEILKLIRPTLDFLHKYVHKPIRDDNYDEIEIAYLIIQMMFDRLTLDKTTMECQKIGNEIIKLVNDELHNYYHYNKKMHNYAYRITEMTKLLSMIREHSTRHREIELISKWMDIIDMSFFDSI
uniref:Nuclear receptor n=1 Tax=Strongyloides venezuelensis TaxID=75913 RepID=A0A0K0FCE9_STRVS